MKKLSCFQYLPFLTTIEFVGLPGAGKTFVCEQLAEYIEATSGNAVEFFPTIDEEVGITTRIGKLCRAGFFTVRHPVLVARVVNWVAKTRQKSFLEFAKKMINLLSELDLADRRSGVWAKDQGVLQAVWSLMLLARRDADWRELLELLIPWLPSAVIYVAIDREENIRRLTSRDSGHSSFDRLAVEDLEAELKRGEALMETLFEERRRLGFREHETIISTGQDTDFDLPFFSFRTPKAGNASPAA